VYSYGSKENKWVYSCGIKGHKSECILLAVKTNIGCNLVVEQIKNWMYSYDSIERKLEAILC
jgi:hypothetical protein